MDLIEKLAANVINTRYEDLPADAIEAVKKGTLDTLGCIIGGASMCTKEVELVREW
jgi:2-methylcitrate dehydratase PrpD